MKDIRLVFRPTHTQDRATLKESGIEIFHKVSNLVLPETSIVLSGLTTEADLGLVSQIIFYDVENDKVKDLIKTITNEFTLDYSFAFYSIDDSEQEDKILYKKY